MTATRKHRMPKAAPVRLPRLMALDPLRPGRHTKARQRAAAPPPAAPSAPLRARNPNGGARANVEARTGGERRMGARVTPLSNRPAESGGPMGRPRPYPAPKANVRERKATVGARSELGARARIREASGHEPTRPHPKSGEGARAAVKARGQARRPAAALPGDTAKRNPKHATKTKPELVGAEFYGPVHPSDRSQDAGVVHPFFRERGKAVKSGHIGRPPE